MLSTELCRLILKLYPDGFQREFASEILSSFTDHYRQEKLAGKTRGMIFISQVSDILDLLSVAVRERIRTIFTFGLRDTDDFNSNEGVIKPMKYYQIVWKWFFAWQALEEAQWLQEMSRAGWEFVEYKWYRYIFRKQNEPVEYEYLFERNLFTWWQIPEEERYIESRAQEGWQFFKYFMMWYYFRRPVDPNRVNNDEFFNPTGKKTINIFPKNTKALLQMGIFLFAATLVLIGITAIPVITGMISNILYLLGGFCTGLGTVFIIAFLVSVFGRRSH